MGLLRKGGTGYVVCSNSRPDQSFVNTPPVPQRGAAIWPPMFPDHPSNPTLEIDMGHTSKTGSEIGSTVALALLKTFWCHPL